MTTITFDTLKFVRRLQESGIPDKQAEAISEAFKEAQESRLDDLASKRDIKDLETNMDAKLAAMELRIIKWLIGASGIIVALLKLLPGGH
ncbi:MAG: DUF1640 domain-containing protein [Magnetococcales bacterium]|nr:DUF1640 domain-containing protein [Magnetococcales bacterium]